MIFIESIWNASQNLQTKKEFSYQFIECRYTVYYLHTKWIRWHSLTMLQFFIDLKQFIIRAFERMVIDDTTIFSFDLKTVLFLLNFSHNFPIRPIDWNTLLFPFSLVQLFLMWKKVNNNSTWQHTIHTVGRTSTGIKI